MKLRRRRPRTVRCIRCKKSIKLKAKGRVPFYCSASCRQRSYLITKYRGPAELLQQDISTVRFRDFIRREILAILQHAGLIPAAPEPPPPPKPPSRLRLVEVITDADTG